MNKFGLSRDINSEVKRTIRQNSGFGCVICGLAIGDYEHVDPEFAEAKAHDPECMTFLCIGCHGKVTRGHISKQAVKSSMLEPAALKKGFSFEAFEANSRAPKVHIGPLIAEDCQSIITVNSRSILWIKSPEVENGPFRLGAEMRNKYGEQIFRIIDNEWRARTNNWDVEVRGNSITIRNNLGDIALVIRTVPPSDLFIDRMDMSIEGYRFWIEKNELNIRTPENQIHRVENLHLCGCESAINLNQEDLAIGYKCKSLLMSGVIGIPKKDVDKKTVLNSIDPKRRRNSLCPCNSSLKYKHCCGRF